MKRNGLCLNLIVTAVLLLAGCAPKPVPSADDPLSGVWSGDYGPSPDSRDPVSLDLRWKDGELAGTVHAGSRSMRLSTASFKAETGDINLEFDAQGNGGQTVHYRIEGKVEGKTITGSWSHDAQKGDFRVTKK